MSRSLPPRLPVLAALAAGALLLPTPEVRATAYNWINPNGGSWTTNTNFSPTSTGTTTADSINFNGSGTAATIGTIGGNNSAGVETISLDANQAIGTLNFYNTGGTTIVGNADPLNTTTETLSLTGSIVVNAGVGPVTFGGNALALSLAGTSSQVTATNNSSNLLTFSGSISSAATPANPIALVIAGVGNTTISGSFVSGPGTKNSVQLTKNGTGTLTLSAPSTAVISLSMTGGAIILDGTTGGSLTASANVSGSGNTIPAFNMGAGSFTLLGNSNGTTVQAFATTTFTGSGTGGGTILVDGGTANAVTVLNLSSNGASSTTGGNSGSSVNLTTARGGTIITASANSNGLIGSGHAIYNGNDFATKLGNAAIGTNGTVGAVTTSALPTTGGSSTTNYLATDNFSQSGMVTPNSLKLTTTQTGQSFSQNNNPLLVTSGGILFTGTNDYAINGGGTSGTITVNSGSAATDLVFHQYSTGTLNVSSAITNSSNANAVTSVTKAGPGTLNLTGASTYTGVTYVNGGMLTANAAGINSAAGGMAISNAGTVFAPAAGTVLTPGAGTGGTATVATANTIIINNGATLAPAGVGTIGMLTLNGGNTTARFFNVGIGSRFAYDLGSGNTSDNITFTNYNPGTGATTNDFVLSRLTSATNGTQAAVYFDFTGAQAGTYTLFSFFSDNGSTAVTSSLNGSYFDLANSTGLNGFSSSLAFNTGSITLTLTAVPEPSTWMSGALAVAVGFFAWRQARRRAANPAV